MIKKALETLAIKAIKAVISLLFYRSKQDVKDYNNDEI